MENLDLCPLAIEVTNRCNMRCIMCVSHGAVWYQGQADSHPKYMEPDFFKDIVDQYIKLEQAGPKSVLPQFQGEPLLHPQFLEMCEYMQQKGMMFSFTTNASLLKKEISQELLRMDQFSNIAFSLDGLTPETYEKVRLGANYAKVVENIHTFIELARKREKPIYISISFTLQPENEHEFEPFVREWVKYADSVSMNNVAIKGRPTKFYFKPEGRIACGDLWHFMVVLTNGQVVPCCRDYLYQLDMGNLRESSLEEVWRGPRYERLRQLQVEGRWNDNRLCADCDTWMCRVPDRVKERLEPDIDVIKGPFFLSANLAPVPVVESVPESEAQPAAPVEAPPEPEPVVEAPTEAEPAEKAVADEAGGSAIGRLLRKVAGVVRPGK